MALVDAATTVFVRDGFAPTAISTITDEAGVSKGSFYNYFRTKEDILRAVIERIHASFYAGTPSAIDAPPMARKRRRKKHTYEELYERLERSNRRFLHNYREHAAFFQLLDEVPRVDPELTEMRKALRARIVNNNTRFIESLQDEGLADPTLQAWHAASALGAMIDRFAYLWFVVGEEFDEETAVRTLTVFWLNALGIHANGGSPTPATSAGPADLSIAERAELDQLREENAQQAADIKTLREAAALFARHSQR
jgi:AcrR family transcriptional regulator